MSREGKLAKNTFVLSIGTFLPKIATFITLPILTGYLTQEEYGTYDLITVLVSLILPIATLQIQTAAFRFLIDTRESDDEKITIISSIFAFIIPTSLIALAILYLFLPGGIGLRFCICLYYLVDIIVNTTRQIARGLDLTKDYSISAIVSALCKLIFAFILVYVFKLGLIGAVISLLVSSSISFIILASRIGLIHYFRLSVFSFGTLKKLLSYSWPMVPNSMSMWIMRVSDRFVITIFLGVAANAVYAVANKIPQILTLAQTTFSMAWQENATIASKDEDAPKYYSDMFASIFSLMSGFMSLIIGISPILFRVLIRGDYIEAYVHIPILLLAMLFYSLSSFVGGIYIAFKKTKSVGITTIVAALCNITIDLGFVNLIGVYAASISTLISYVFLFIFRLRNIRKIVEFKFDARRVIMILFFLIVQCCIYWLRNRYANLANSLIGVVIFYVLNRDLIRRYYLKLCKRLKKNAS